jgi:hypothetical protein
MPGLQNINTNNIDTITLVKCPKRCKLIISVWIIKVVVVVVVVDVDVIELLGIKRKPDEITQD